MAHGVQQSLTIIHITGTSRSKRGHVQVCLRTLCKERGWLSDFSTPNPSVTASYKAQLMAAVRPQPAPKLKGEAMPIRNEQLRREYHKRYMKEIYYPKNKAKQLLANQAKRQALRKRISDIKLERGCYDCGYNKAPEALDFDHVKGEKLFGVATARSNGLAWERVLGEMAKCHVVCANCHRIRTRRRKLGANI